MTHEIEVLNMDGGWIGTAASFGEARRMQQHSLPDALKAAYAGIGTQGQPLFYEEHLPEDTKDSVIDAESARSF